MDETDTLPRRSETRTDEHEGRFIELKRLLIQEDVLFANATNKYAAALLGSKHSGDETIVHSAGPQVPFGTKLPL